MLCSSGRLFVELELTTVAPTLNAVWFQIWHKVNSEVNEKFSKELNGARDTESQATKRLSAQQNFKFCKSKPVIFLVSSSLSSLLILSLLLRLVALSLSRDFCCFVNEVNP